MIEGQRNREKIEAEFKANSQEGMASKFYRLTLEVLLDIRDNTERPDLTSESITEKIRQMKDVSEGLTTMANMAQKMGPPSKWKNTK